LCRAIAQAVGHRPPTSAAGFHPRLGQVEFVVDKVALGQVFSEYTHHHHLSSGAGTIGPLMDDVPSGLSLIPPHEIIIIIIIIIVIIINSF
jgi:hypothetical protein